MKTRVQRGKSHKSNTEKAMLVQRGGDIMTGYIAGHRAAGFGERRAMTNETKAGSNSCVHPTRANYSYSANPKFTPRQVSYGRRTLWQAEQWRRNNPEAWRFIVNEACKLAKDGRPIAVHGLIEAVRKRGFVNRYGHDTKTNNNYCAVFARWLAIEYPETVEYIEHRSSIFDELISCRN